MRQQFDKEAQTRAAKAAWAASPALRAEFASEETFVAYRLAEARGAVKVYGARGAVNAYGAPNTSAAPAQPQSGKQPT